ncbi:hypothetical protein O9G_004133 [Rozella allomycis CSF55]|uniref:Uncharacterized protein n=1 Tax=Rozella allomycis (strain CSF55) TaxID=988480 RepID=A0A075AVJ7_ROZAC|nr:hypothetical protein O9G_004133 [Rozella allomycis CSF55]|eukprot:EPZ32559.1 hypothetical protein O9G_004133 [Rozella allomycis CSF55]
MGMHSKNMTSVGKFFIENIIKGLPEELDHFTLYTTLKTFLSIKKYHLSCLYQLYAAGGGKLHQQWVNEIKRFICGNMAQIDPLVLARLLYDTTNLIVMSEEEFISTDHILFKHSSPFHRHFAYSLGMCSPKSKCIPVLFYVMASIPTFVANRLSQDRGILSNNTGLDFGYFVSSIFVVSGIAFPIVLYRAQVIPEILELGLSVAGGILIYGSVTAYSYIFTGDDYY